MGVIAANGQQRGVNFYSLEKEMALGKGLAAEVERHSQPLKIEPVENYLQTMVDRLADGFPERPFPYTVRLLGEDSGLLTHEPIALPGGYLFISASLVNAAHSDAELAGMLAHSMAHVVARHGTRQGTRAQLIGVSGAPLIYMGGWNGYSADNRKSLVPLGLLWNMRRFEEEADRMAIPALARAGYDPAALVAYLRRVQPERTAEDYPAMPEKARRLAGMEAAIRELPSAAFDTRNRLPGIQGELRRLSPSVPKPEPPRLRRER